MGGGKLSSCACCKPCTCRVEYEGRYSLGGRGGSAGTGSEQVGFSVGSRGEVVESRGESGKAVKGRNGGDKGHILHFGI